MCDDGLRWREHVILFLAANDCRVPVSQGSTHLKVPGIYESTFAFTHWIRFRFNEVPTYPLVLHLVY